VLLLLLLGARHCGRRGSRVHLVEGGQRVGQLGEIVCGICATIGQYLLPLPLGAPILVPGFNLRVAQAKPLGQLAAVLHCEVLLALELALERLQLEIGEGGARLAGLLVGLQRGRAHMHIGQVLLLVRVAIAHLLAHHLIGQSIVRGRAGALRCVLLELLLREVVVRLLLLLRVVVARLLPLGLLELRLDCAQTVCGGPQVVAGRRA